MSETSVSQQNFLQKKRQHKRNCSQFPFSHSHLVFGNLGIHCLKGFIDSFIFSSPSKVAACFWSMVCDKSIFLHITVTLYETLVSFFLVILCSLLVTILLWFSPKLSEILEPFLVVLNSLPKSALHHF